MMAGYSFDANEWKQQVAVVSESRGTNLPNGIENCWLDPLIACKESAILYRLHAPGWATPRGNTMNDYRTCSNRRVMMCSAFVVAMILAGPTLRADGHGTGGSEPAALPTTGSTVSNPSGGNADAVPDPGQDDSSFFSVDRECLLKNNDWGKCFSRAGSQGRRAGALTDQLPPPEFWRLRSFSLS